MINPNRVHRIKGKVESIGPHTGNVRVKSKGTSFEGWPKTMPKGLQVGEWVNCQVQFSICLDRYTIQTCNRPRKVKGV
jgi:hypothetical protein